MHPDLKCMFWSFCGSYALVFALFFCVARPLSSNPGAREPSRAAAYWTRGREVQDKAEQNKRGYCTMQPTPQEPALGSGCARPLVQVVHSVCPAGNAGPLFSSPVQHHTAPPEHMGMSRGPTWSAVHTQPRGHCCDVSAPPRLHATRSAAVHKACRTDGSAVGGGACLSLAGGAHRGRWACSCECGRCYLAANMVPPPPPMASDVLERPSPPPLDPPPPPLPMFEADSQNFASVPRGS